MNKKLVILTTLVLLFFSNKDVIASGIPDVNITYTYNLANPRTYTFTFTVFKKSSETHPATIPSVYFILTNTCGLVNPVVSTFNQVGVAQDIYKF